ncbi:MAG: hypothetical protein ABIN18_22325 [Pseudomonadota bacterium]
MSKRKKPEFISPPPETPKTKHQFAPGKIGYHDKKPIFAFTYYFDDNKKWSFCCVKESSNFHVLFRNLYHMSQLTWSAILKAKHQFHAHEVEDFSRLALCVRNHFNGQNIRELPPFQFKAFDEKSRIIGVFTNNAVFEIICIDLNHATYTSRH